MERKTLTYFSCIWVILFCLATITFFAPVMIDLKLLKLLSWGIIALTFMYVFRDIFFTIQKNSRYAQIMKIFVMVILSSMITAYVFHGQDIFKSVTVVLTNLSLFIFFFFYKNKISIRYTEKIIWVMLIIHLMIFFIALAYAPAVIFDLSDSVADVNMSRVIARVKVLGVGFVYLGFFMALNKMTVPKFNYKYGILSFFLFIIILMNVSRQHIIFSLLVGILLVFKNVKWYFKIISIALTAYFVTYLFENVEVVKNLFQLTTSQIDEDGMQNIRVRAFKYFFLDYNDNWGQILFGNGIVHLSSNWGMKEVASMYKTGFVMADVGYAKLYVYWGAIGVLLLMYLSMKIFTQKIPPTLDYCKYYFLFMLLTNVASHSFFTDMVQVAFVIYILDVSYRTQYADKANLLKT